MSIPVTTKSGVVRYIKVDLASNQLQVKCNDGEYHVSEDLNELAEDVDMYDSEHDCGECCDHDHDFNFNNAQTSAMSLLQRCAEEFAKMHYKNDS
jgi:hypothetical protein